MPTDLTIPETIGACADLLFDVRAKRWHLERLAEEWHQQEIALKEHIIRVLPKTETLVGGLHHAVRVVTKTKPRITDWDAFYAHIRETGDFELMQRRPSDAAIQERWEQENEVPGVGTYTVIDVLLTKV